MKSPAPGLQVSEFSTAAYRPVDSIPAWREQFGRTLLRIDIAPQSPERFRARAMAYQGRGFGLLRASTSAAHKSNSRELISNDDVSFGVATSSRWRATQLGRSAELERGDGVFMSNSDIGSITLLRDCQFTTFGLSRSLIAPLIPDLGAMFARRIPAVDPALRMLTRYLELAATDDIISTPQLAAAFITHVADLLALTLGATRDAAELAKGRGARAARIHAIKADILANVGRPHLSVDALARAHQITPRQVQRLFEVEGTTFTEFVLQERLALARRLLAAPGNATRPISAIALEAGFGDLSYFNRSFRRRYGATPSEIRGANPAG